jgi:hypothetical protein
MNNELRQYPGVEWATGVDTEQFLTSLSLGAVRHWQNVAMLASSQWHIVFSTTSTSCGRAKALENK